MRTGYFELSVEPDKSVIDLEFFKAIKGREFILNFEDDFSKKRITCKMVTRRGNRIYYKVLSEIKEER